MSAFETYIRDLQEIRATGAAVKETSYYGALEKLLNELGKTLKPKVRCVMQLKNIGGAGMPDGGIFTASQFQKKTGDTPTQPTNPERGVIEIKGTGDDAWVTAQTQQVSKYWKQYRQVLVTNYRDFVLIGQDSNGQPITLETYRLAKDEAEFWLKAKDPKKFAEEQEEQVTEYLKRVMLQAASIATPKDLAWFLASYAKDAKARIEKTDLPALETLRKALEEALGITFTGDKKDPKKGERFFKSTLVQTLFYGIFSAWVLWHKQQEKGRFDWRVAGYYLHVPMIKALFEKVATPTHVRKLDLEEVLNWAGEALNRVDREAFFSKFEEGQAVQYFYEPFLEAFDPALRKELGVWYTPPEIVQYMVARVDTVLREELQIEDGLADPNVYILDPCCGTGAFVVEVLRRIEANLQDRGMGALVGSQLKEAAMKRVFGFEILTAPFVVAHLQLGLLLQNLGVPLSDDQERVGVYLTNALTGWNPLDPEKEKFVQLQLAGLPELQEERDAAERIKRSKKILVVLGNPPYNSFAGMAVDEERELSNAYRTTKKAPKPQGQGLNDLYTRFFRMAERQIVEETGKGVVCFISNYSYLDGLSFTGMRERYLEVFDDIWIDCLNGDKFATGKVTPTGEPDPSIFSTEWNKEGIQVGTAIGLFVKRGDSPLSQLGEQQDSLSSPSPFSHSGEKGSKKMVGGDLERWEVPRDLEAKMLEVARQFRKEPTPSEGILWQALRRKQLEGRKFRRQQPIGRFVVDFFCASEQLIVEVDGGIHESQKDLDEQRQTLLESLGLRFVRVSGGQVENNLADVLGLIRAAFNHPLPIALENHPLPLTPSPIKGEGEPEGVDTSLTPSPLVGEGAGGEGQMSQRGHIKFRDLWGVAKRQQLLESLAEDSEDTYQAVKPAIALGLPLKPRKFEQAYTTYPKLNELFSTSFPGVKTSRDDMVIDIDKEELTDRLKQYFNIDVSHEEIGKLCPRVINDTGRYNSKTVRSYLLKRGFLPQYVVRYCYRPLDNRWIYWEPETKLLDEKSSAYFPHIFSGNLWIEARQKQTMERFDRGYVTSVLADNFGNGLSSFFPLLLDNSGTKQTSILEDNDKTIIENLSLESKAYISQLKVTASDLFHHTIAVLHCSAYRVENSGALRQDFPRIPLPDRRETLIASANLGRQIAALLDPETPVVGITSGKIRPELKTIAVVSRIGTGNLDPNTDFALTAGWGHAGQNSVTMPGRGKVIDRDYFPEEPLAPHPSPTRGEGLLGAATHDIYLNDIAYWKNIPDRVWSYTIGGYQVIKKWLSYRELELLGRSLKQEEVIEVTQMARRIAAILLLEPELDANYEAVKQATYPWPTQQ